MRLNLTKLENVRRRGLNIIAQCPACAEAGGDRKGEHLFIDNSGRFGCVLYPGVDGQPHRQRIYYLAGGDEMANNAFEVRKPISSPTTEPTVFQKDILGRLGHMNLTAAQKRSNIAMEKIDNNHQEDSKESVPSVPIRKSEHQSEVSSTIGDERFSTGMDAAILEMVRIINEISEATFVSVVGDTNERVIGYEKAVDWAIKQNLELLKLLQSMKPYI